jgi:hypothetical protein
VTTPQRRHDLLAVTLLVILPTILFWDVLTGVNGLYLRDLSRYHYPMKQILREVVRGGEFPYWNRYFSGGQPLAANPQHEVFYPPNWLIFLPSYDLGFRLHVLLHIYVALLGMYALLRSMELRAEPAVFGAIAFGLGGIVLSLVNLLPIFFCAVWIPLTCLFVRRFLLQPNPRDFALSSLVFGLQCLTGEPTTLLQTGFIIGLYALYRGWHQPSRALSMLRNAAWIAAISIGALLVGAVQIIPARDLMRDSIRAEGFNFDLVAAWSMPPAKIAELVFPNLLGHASINGLPWYWAARLYPSLGIPFLLNIYCGLAVVAFVVAGVVRRVRGSGLFAILFSISVLIALGAYTPFLGILYRAGIASSLRYPEKFILMGVFAAIVFSARVLDRALAGDARIIEIATAFTLATGIVASVICLLGYTPYSVDGFLAAFGLEPSGGAMLMISQAWSDWRAAAARALALLILLLTMHRTRRAVWATAALLFVCGDLALVVYELNPRITNQFFTQRPPLADALPANRAAYRLYHQADWETGTETGHKFFRSGLQSYWVARNGLFPAINVAYGVSSVMERDYDKTALRPTTEFGRAVRDISRAGRPDWWLPLMAMSNAWYRAGYNDFEEEERNAEGDFTRLAPVALIEGEHQPRYYFADQIMTIAGSRDFVSRMTTETYSRNVALANTPAFIPVRGTVDRVEEHANDATIDVTAPGRGFLVMSVTPHKYWRIAIDGMRASPVVTNVAYQGVVVPAGRHRITMKYRNTLIPICGAISIITILSLAGVVLRWRTA